MTSRASGQPTRALFLCTGNSARSIMAEAVARSLGGNVLEARSAGTKPVGVNPLTLRVLREAGCDTEGLRSKAVAEVAEVEFDLIVTLCDSARQECPFLPGRARRLHWDLPDPAAAVGDEASRLQVFREVFASVRRLVSELVESLDEGGGVRQEAPGDGNDGRREEAGRSVIAAMSPREVLDAVGRRQVLIFDIRPGHETSYRQFDLPGAVIVQEGDLADVAASLPRDRLVVVADSVGLRSRAAAARLLDAGIPSVAVMTGGMVEWERDGLPVMKDPDFELRGQCGCKLRARGKKPLTGTGRGHPEVPEKEGMTSDGSVQAR